MLNTLIKILTVSNVIFLAAVVILFFVLKFFRRKAKELEYQLQELKESIRVERKVSQDFKELDREREDETKEINSGTAADRFNASIDLLRKHKSDDRTP